MIEVTREQLPEAFDTPTCKAAQASLLNLNGNVMVAIDCERTGPVSGFHDMIQICVLALDNTLRPQKGVRPFYLDLLPRRPEYCTREYTRVSRDRICHVMQHGLDPDIAADLFDDWFQKLALKHGKQLSPLAWNWPPQRDFMIDWLGRTNFDHLFESRYRDVQTAALYVNDRADFQVEQIPFARVGLGSLGNKLNVENERRADCLQDCLTVAEVYRKLVKI